MLTESISFPAAFMAGLLSFFSPCILPLIPGYFTFITGFSLEKLTQDEQAEIRRKVVFSTLLFVLGFSFVFVLMGASASYLGGLFFQYRKFIRIVGGILIIVLGIHLIGLVRIPGLDLEKRIHLDQKPLHFLGTFLIGMAFAAGWSPCIGPLLGSILIVAGSQETVWQGTLLLGVYSAGLAIPFIIMSVFINYVLVFIKKAVKTMKFVNAVAGILLIITGLFLVTNKLYILSG
jgi:cytochrome c-type biogenesis protein